MGRWGKGIKDPRHPPLGVSSGRSSSTRAGSFPSCSSTHTRLGANFTQRGSQRHRLLTRSHLEGHRFLPAAAVTLSLPVPHTTEKLAYPLFVLKYQANVAQANVAVATDRLYKNQNWRVAQSENNESNKVNDLTNQCATKVGLDCIQIKRSVE